MNQAMLLPVTRGWNEDGFAIFIFDPGELHSQITNEIGVVEDEADTALLQFIHGLRVMSDEPGEGWELPKNRFLHCACLAASRSGGQNVEEFAPVHQ